MTEITEKKLPKTQERSPIEVYVFDRKSGEYAGQSQAQPDPMDSSNWLIPAGATTDEPPQAGSEEVAVRVGGKYGSWEIKIDKRGTEYWLPDRSKHVIKEIGEDLPPNALLDEPPVPIDEQFQAEMDALNAQYEKDTEKAVKKVAHAVAWDGVTETTKIENARAELAQLKQNYDAQSANLISQYYGG